MWDAGSGALERTLSGQCGAVLAVAVDGARMVSASQDRTMRVWSLETGACQQTVAVQRGRGKGRKDTVGCLAALAVVGAEVVGGTKQGRVWVWVQLLMEQVHSLELAGRPAVRGLVACGRMCSR